MYCQSVTDIKRPDCSKPTDPIAMKTLRIILVLLIVAAQANATGFAHNMFVAQKKLQAGKEVQMVKTKATVTRKVCVEKVGTKHATVKKSNESAVQQFASKVSNMVTLNERILAENPMSFFAVVEEEEKEASVSFVSKMAGFVKASLFAIVSTSFGRR